MDFRGMMSQGKIIASSATLAIAIFLGETVGIPFTELTHAQEITAYILVIAAILWVSEWVPLFVVSFLILALELVWLLPELNAQGVSTSTSTVFSAFFSNLILLFIGGFVLSSLMQKYGIDLRFAQVILKATHGNPSSTLLGIILTCAFLSMWISNTATAAMMLTIVFPLLKNIPEDHRFRSALILSIPFACNIGGIGTPIGTPPNAIALTYLGNRGIDVGFAEWMALTAPFMLLLLAFLWLLLLRLHPPKNLIINIKARHTGAFSTKHWLTVLIFITTAAGWFFSKSLGLKTGTVALFPVIACFWLRLLDTNDFRNLPWDILYIISGGLALGVALEVSGLGALIVSAIPTDVSAIYLIVLGAAIAATMSTVMSNTATAGLIIPLVVSINVNEHFLLSLVLAIALMCSLAMALPVTTPPNAIAFSSRAIKTKDMILSGGIITLVGLAVVIFIGPWYWNFILRHLSLV